MPRDVSTGLFVGEGEVRTLCREKDWSRTPLGPPEEWSPTLRSTVRTVLASPFPITLWCGEELTLIYNDGYRRVLAAKHPEALGRPGYEVWGEIWEHIAPMFERIRAGGAPIYAEDEPFSVERVGEGEASDGPEEPNAWFTFSLSPVRDEEGSIVAFFNVVSETTGRLRAEREKEEARARAERAEGRLLEIFDRAPAFMAVLRGRDHVFEYANQAYHDLVGRQELIGLPAFEVLPEAREQGFDELLDRVVETGEPFVGKEVPIDLRVDPGAEGERRYLDFVYYPLEEPDGTVSGVVAHGYDVTEHVRSRKAAQRARTEAEEANQAKSRFLGTMSHELRTPIHAILGYTELLSDEIAGPLTEAQRTQVERVWSSTRHLRMLVNDILDLARVEAGQVNVDLESVRMADTVAAALSLIRLQARERELDLESLCADEESPLYVGDRERVRQILVNLLSNALKFTPAGGTIRVTFGTGRPPERSGTRNRRMAFVSVADTGIGIPSEEMESIFQLFTQGDRGETSTWEGTGLGLAISRQLAELMEGFITAESEVDEGSTFTLWLPRHDPDDAPTSRSAPPGRCPPP